MTDLSHKLPKCIICGSAPEVLNECGVQIRIQCSNEACGSGDCIATDYDEAAAMWIYGNTPIVPTVPNVPFYGDGY